MEKSLVPYGEEALRVFTPPPQRVGGRKQSDQNTVWAALPCSSSVPFFKISFSAVKRIMAAFLLRAGSRISESV